MKLFISHSSKDKSLVRETLALLPKQITTPWIDERNILWGTDLDHTIESAIQSCDFFVVFLGKQSIRSKWVKKEISWAFKWEKVIDRNFILPVLTEDIDLKQIRPVALRKRNHLKYNYQTESDVSRVANEITLSLFQWVDHIWEKSKESHPDNDMYSLSLCDFNEFLSSVASALGKDNSKTPGIVCLLHWVPTFSLSRGLNEVSDHIVSEESPVYDSLKKALQKSHGRVVCFNGTDLYRFLYETRILYHDYQLFAEYLQEVLLLFSTRSIEIHFIPWGFFPYNLITIGKHFAAFDLTTIKDLQELAGHKQAKFGNTLLILTTHEASVLNICRNIFDVFFEACTENHDEIREHSIRFLESVIKDLQTRKIVGNPDEYHQKFWPLNK